MVSKKTICHTTWQINWCSGWTIGLGCGRSRFNAAMSHKACLVTLSLSFLIYFPWLLWGCNKRCKTDVCHSELLEERVGKRSFLLGTLVRDLLISLSSLSIQVILKSNKDLQVAVNMKTQTTLVHQILLKSTIQCIETWASREIHPKILAPNSGQSRTLQGESNRLKDHCHHYVSPHKVNPDLQPYCSVSPHHHHHRLTCIWLGHNKTL